MTVDEARQGYYEYTRKAGEITRQLSLAGIAVIWAFRIGSYVPGGLTWSAALKEPLILFIAALAFDCAQYFYASIAWGCYSRHKEKQFQNAGQSVDEQDFDAPRQINWLTNTFLILKCLSMAAGSVLLIARLARSI